MNAHELERCAECGGEMRISRGPGRTRSYRGEDGYTIPDDLEYPACDGCGARWLTGAQIDRLSDALESQRAARRR